MSNEITPWQRALLNTVSYAEGTWDPETQRPRYNVTFGYQTFDPSKPHPERVVRSGRYASNAAGAYQFLSPTWKGLHGGVNKPLTPENQDVGALKLISRRGVDSNRPLTDPMLNKLAPEWASLPTTSGKSYYGQPVKTHKELHAFYNAQLKALSGQGGAAARPAGSAPASNPGNGPAAAPPRVAAGGGPGLMPRRDDGDQLLNAIRQTGEMAASIGSNINRTLGQKSREISRGFAPVQAAITDLSRPAAVQSVLGQMQSLMPRSIPGIRVPGLTVPGLAAPTAALRRLISIGGFR